MKKKIIVILSLTAFIFGCRGITKYVYVIHRDVPETPSFVVLPFNVYHQYILISDMVESSLLKSGIRVVRRPEAKEVETRKNVGVSKLQNESSNEVPKSWKNILREPSVDGVGASESRIERYYQYEEIKADFIVETNGRVSYYNGAPNVESINIKVIGKENKVIITSILTDSYSIDQDVFNMLKAMGLNVKKNNYIEIFQDNSSKTKSKGSNI